MFKMSTFQMDDNHFPNSIFGKFLNKNVIKTISREIIPKTAEIYNKVAEN